VRGPLGGGGRRSRILSPPRDAAQGDQWKTAVNGNKYSSGRALDDESVDNNNNRLGGGGLVWTIVNEDDRAGAWLLIKSPTCR
jgi:hypothetical protein